MSPPTRAALLRQNRELYDDTFGRVWKEAIFDGLHQGREFINLGGAPLLRAIAGRLRLTSASRVLELCSGPGAVAVHLASLYQCSVTGIDINPKQVAHARAISRRLAGRTSRLTFINADACAWRSRSRYDAVVSVDGFMLLPSPAAALQVAYDSLLDGGRVCVATLAAGRRLDESTRRFAAELDGMVNLRSQREYERLMRAAGLSGVRVVDLTPMAVRASVKMLRCLERVDAGDGWIRVSQRYLDAFLDDRLRYLLVSGSRDS
jgi:SAM-dependent methyltransferase